MGAVEMGGKNFVSEAEDFLRHCRVVLTLSKNTLEAYENDLAQFANEVKKPLTNLETDDIYEFLANFSNPNTHNRKLSAINSFLDYCYENLTSDRKFKLARAKTPRSLPKYMPPEAIFSACEQTKSELRRRPWVALRDHALILFLYASGARISEALKAEIADIEDGWLKIRYAKGAKERLVPIAKKSLESLDNYLNARPFSSPLLFINYQGGALSRIFAFRVTERLLGVSPHALRHSFATSLISNGADLRVVQELLGHASLNTTQIYTHLEKKQLFESVEQCHPLFSVKY